MKRLSTLFRQLPQVLINIILSYNGTIKYRNGVYINQLSNTDSRYNLLRAIKLPKCMRYKYYDLPDGRINYSYLLYIDNILPNTQMYVVDVNPIWNRVIYYIMDNSTGLIVHQLDKL